MLVSIVIEDTERAKEFLYDLDYPFRVGGTFKGYVVRVERDDAPTFLKMLKEANLKGRYL